MTALYSDLGRIHYHWLADLADCDIRAAFADQQIAVTPTYLEMASVSFYPQGTNAQLW